MNCNLKHLKKSALTHGYALATTFIVVTAGFLITAGIISWSSQSASVADRNADFQKVQLEAETSVETISAALLQNFRNNPVNDLRGALNGVASLVPILGQTLSSVNTLLDNSLINCTTIPTYGPVPSTSPMLYGLYDTVTISGTATNEVADQIFKTKIEQKIRLVEAPLFQFQFFYQPDMEMGFSDDFTMNGRAHSNGKIFLHPSDSLVVKAGMSAASSILEQKSPLNPEYYSKGTVIYKSETEAHYKKLGLRMGDSISVTNLRLIVEKPEAPDAGLLAPLQTVTSPLQGLLGGLQPVTAPVVNLTSTLLGGSNPAVEKQMYYNKADMIIRITSQNKIVATSGAYNNFLVSVSSQLNTIISTNTSFYDKREDKTVYLTQLNVIGLRSKFSNLKNLLGRQPNTIYIVDERNFPWGKMGAVRIIGGQVLPAGGLTVASPNPVYVQGHFNAAPNHTGSTNTTAALPASIVGDAVTILSGSWNDSDSHKSVKHRDASDTTVNAAIITGIVPSNGSDYSGGVENALRLLEDWNGETLTFNGSIAVLFYSKYADNPWSDTKQVYSAPTRKWSWDPYLATAGKQPPGAPMLSVVVREPWQRKASL